MPTADRDSSPEHSDEADPPIEEEEEVEEEGEEEVEEEQEEVEEEEEEMEVDEEEEDDEEGEEDKGDERAGAGDEEKDKDTSKKLESEGHAEDLKLVSPTPGRAESNPATPSKDATGVSFVASDSSVKVRIENKEEPPNMSAADQEEHISSEEKGCSGSLADEKENTVHLEKKMHADSEHAKNFFLHAHGSAQAHLSCGDSVSSENTATLQVHNKELAENMLKGGSVIGKSDGILEKEVSQLQSETESKMLEDLSLSSIHTPQCRPRSSSPGATPENSRKRPAVLCAFFATGWCIKGNSCRFLHQKEGSKEDLAEPNKKEDVLDGTGCREEFKRSRISSSQERPDSSNTEGSSKSQLQIQRGLVKAYGGDSHDPHHIHDDHNLHTGEEFHKVDIPKVGTLIQDDNKSPFGVSPRFDYMDEMLSSREHLSSSRYLHEEQLQREIPKRGFLNDLPFPRGSSLTKSSAVPEHRYYSGTSSTSSSLYFNINPFSNDRRTEDFSFRNHQSSFPLHGSHSSYCLHGSFSSTFNSSYQPAPAPSFSSELPDTHKTFYLGKYHSSRSASLPRSAPYFSRPEVENGLLRNVPRDLQASVIQKIEILENSWEPSVPFRPSFHYVPPSLSSPGRQYDPLLDSIEPCDTGNIAIQASEWAINVSISDCSNKGDHLFYGSQIPEHNVERTPSSFPQPHEGILDKSKPADELSTQTSLVATPGHTAADGGNNSVPKEEKHLPDHLVESANVNGAEHVDDSRHQGDKSKINKESKAMKIFRSALVDFVKDLVKPSWREGHLSKDAHKMVVKKAVEKVLGALQTHQIPNTTGSIDQYLSTSRPKLLKLVEGYLEKYTKS